MRKVFDLKGITVDTRMMINDDGDSSEEESRDESSMIEVFKWNTSPW